jgi:hypothetical protein
MKPDFKIKKQQEEEVSGPAPSNFKFEDDFRLPRFQKTGGVAMPQGLTAK